MFTQGVITDRIIVFKKNNEIFFFFFYTVHYLKYICIPIT